jgi:signal transduction histidine kinase
MAHSLTDGQTIELEAEDDSLIVDGDPGRLEQIFLNLLTNAVTHAPDSKRVEVHVRRTGSEAEIAVQDYGPGIAEADLPNLFSRYFAGTRSEHERSSGLGLGLFITDQLVRAHGGAITVDSRPGDGATFTVRLPLADQSDGRQPEVRSKPG